ncbi:MAG TPA: MFS transporter [Candidatus Saccharimonadia bacterium]|nr:MFS transporter [Candidatus Saccharimonadia bacterium]
MRQQPSSPLLVVLAYVGFISLGLPDGLLGVAWPSMRVFFHLPLDALGTLLVTFTTGYLLSSCSSGRLLARINVGSLLALSCLATAASLLGYALTPRWGIMVALGVLSGLGAGAIDAGVNTYVATRYSPRMVNWLHACYGIGATSGPVIMTSVLAAGLPWQWGYGIVGLGQLVLALCFGLTHTWWPAATAARDTSAHTPVRTVSSRSTLRLPVVWLGIAVFFLYTGMEAATGTWTYSLFTEARAIPASTAGMWVSMYWGSLTVGRLLSGAIVSYVSVSLLLRLCIIGVILGATLIWLNMTSMLSCVGLALIGLALAPIFPSLIATTPERLGNAHTANGVGFQIAAAVLGQSLLPGMMGILARHLGLEIVGPALLAAALGLLVLYEIFMALSPHMQDPSGYLGACDCPVRRRAGKHG